MKQKIFCSILAAALIMGSGMPCHRAMAAETAAQETSQTENTGTESKASDTKQNSKGYTVYFYGNGGKGKILIGTLKKGQSAQLPLGTFSRNGYYCTGWNTKANGKGKQYKPGQKIKNLSKKNGAVVKLYATWKSVGKKNRSMAKQVVTIVNQKRKAKGLKPLKLNKNLNGIATQRAKEISQNFSHFRMDGSFCDSIYYTADYAYCASGENIAYGQRSAASVMNAWMHSPMHKSNILNSGFKEIGVGCYYQGGVYYWVQCFGTRW